MITQQDLTPGTRLAIKKDKSQLGADALIEVCYPGEATVVVKTQGGKEIQTDYAALSAMYDIVPNITPTEENFMPRAKEQIELMIMHLTAFTQTTSGGVNDNILAIGSKLHSLKEELEGYVILEGLEEVNPTELALKQHLPASESQVA
jgi:hypothetical protein